MPDVDHAAALRVHTAPGEETRHVGNGGLGRGQTDPREAPTAQRIEALEGECEVRSALVRCQRVDLVDDRHRGSGQHAPARRRTEQDVERLRRGHQDVRRSPCLTRALRRRRVAGAYGGADDRVLDACRVQPRENPGERFLQIALDVVGERLQRRYVDHRRGLLRRPLDDSAHEPVDGREESCQGLPRPGRSSHQHVLATRLCLGRRREAGAEPVGDGGMKSGDGVHGEAGQVSGAVNSIRTDLYRSGQQLAILTRIDRSTGPRRIDRAPKSHDGAQSAGTGNTTSRMRPLRMEPRGCGSRGGRRVL